MFPGKSYFIVGDEAWEERCLGLYHSRELVAFSSSFFIASRRFVVFEHYETVWIDVICPKATAHVVQITLEVDGSLASL